MSSSVLNRVLAVLGSSLGTQAITILFTPILVRLLGVAAYGEYSFMLSVLAISNVVVSAGTFDSARKFIAERRTISDWQSRVFGVYVRVVLVFGGVFAFVLVAITQFGVVELLLSEAYVPYFYLLALLVPLQAIFVLSRSALMGVDLEARSEPLLVLKKLLFVVLALVLVWLGWNVVGVLLGRLFGLFVVVGLALVILRNQLDLSMVAHPEPASFPRRALLSYNISTVAFKLFVTSLYNIDIMFLGILVGSTATGSYRAALVVAQFLWLIPTAVQVGLLHSTSRLWANGEHSRISALSSRAVRLTLVFTLLLVLGVAALAEPLVSLYFGKGFTRTPETVLYLLPGVLGFAVARPIYATSQGHGNLRPILLATGTAAALNVVLNLVLIPRYGTVGAAVATSIGYGSMVIFHVWAARTVGFDPIANLRPLRIAATAALAAIPIFGLPRLLEENIVQLVVVPPVGFVVYMILALRTRAVDPSEVRMLVASGPVSMLGEMLPSRIVVLLRRSIDMIIGVQR